MIYVMSHYLTYALQPSEHRMMSYEELVLPAGQHYKFCRQRRRQGRQIAVGEPGRQADVEKLPDESVSPDGQKAAHELRAFARLAARGRRLDGSSGNEIADIHLGRTLGVLDND
jgi:hypothetical protein